MIKINVYDFCRMGEGKAGYGFDIRLECEKIVFNRF